MSTMEAPVATEDFCRDAGFVVERSGRTPVTEVTSKELMAILGIGTGERRKAPAYKLSIPDAVRSYPEWTGAQLSAWRAFMPTHYSRWMWHDYRFDRPPVKALQAIIRAENSGLFEHMEIWTPEPNPQVRTFREVIPGICRVIGEAAREFIEDPVAVGYIGNRQFPIVRWGGTELVSDREVMRIGRRRVWRQRLLLGYPL